MMNEMAIDDLKNEFHHLIEKITNERILEHFYLILNNLAKSEEANKNLIKEIEPGSSREVA